MGTDRLQIAVSDLRDALRADEETELPRLGVSDAGERCGGDDPDAFFDFGKIRRKWKRRRRRSKCVVRG